jgi:hypothetical protein
VAGINFAERLRRDRSRAARLRFANKRAEAYWKFREALDPERRRRHRAAARPRAARRPVRAAVVDAVSGIQVEKKEDIAKRIGRSPDCGDAVVLAR